MTIQTPRSQPPGGAGPLVRGIGKLSVRQSLRPTVPLHAQELVSVVIPCFNYATYLPAAVESVLSQGHVRTEVIIVDDCSTDQSLEAARRLAKLHPNVRVVEHVTNRGPVETFNDGLAAATGDFLVRLDADDLLTPGSLCRAVAVLNEHENVGLVYGHPLHFSGDTLPKPRLQTSSVTLWPGSEWLARRCRDGLNVITSPEVVMRKSLVDRVGGQQPLAHTHDMEMWLRLAAFSDVAYLRGCDQAWHREHALSLSAQKVDVLLDLKERRRAFDTLFSGVAGLQPGASELSRGAELALDRASIKLAQHELDRHGTGTLQLELLLNEVRSSLTGTRNEVDRLQKQARGTLSPSRKIFALGRRLKGKIRTESSWRRWHRTGEF